MQTYRMGADFPDGFGRLKKPMVQRMAKLADIKHVSGTMTEEMRECLHRYLKEHGPNFALSNVDVEQKSKASASTFIIPAKTFAFLVRKSCESEDKTKVLKKWQPEELEEFHYIVENWWLELFKRSKRIADHREHSVVQWKDVELALELASLLPIPSPTYLLSANATTST